MPNLHKVKVGDFIKIYDEERKTNDFYRVARGLTSNYDRHLDVSLVYITNEDFLTFAPPEWFDEK